MVPPARDLAPAAWQWAVYEEAGRLRSAATDERFNLVEPPAQDHDRKVGPSGKHNVPFALSAYPDTADDGT